MEIHTGKEIVAPNGEWGKIAMILSLTILTATCYIGLEIAFNQKIEPIPERDVCIPISLDSSMADYMITTTN